ncbi:MAG: hypothetical protein HZC54_14685 [Verrucomicrobia bacterium]|nr:hypothetical protein [Verrucomicrobiota bacterium]
MTAEANTLNARLAAAEAVPSQLLSYAALFLLLSLLTFWSFLQTGFCTTDDMLCAMGTYRDAYDGAKAQGRLHIMSLHGFTAIGSHRLGEALGGHTMVNALALLSVVTNAVLLGHLLCLVSRSFHFGFLASCVWVATVQDSWSFFPLVGAPILYSLPFSFFLLALAFQEHFLRTNKAHLAWLSAFLYFLSLQYSEMFICLFPVFPLLLARHGGAAFKLKNLLVSLLPVALFSAAYLGFRLGFPSAYEGNTFTGTFAASTILSTLSSYVLPSVPTWQFFVRSPFGSGHSFSDLSTLCGGNCTITLLLKSIAGINPAVIVKGLALSALAVHATRRIARTPPAGTAPLFLFALFLMVLPNVPFALNGKYQAWASWLSGYTGTYYSTFGAAVLWALLLCFTARLPGMLSIPLIFLTTFIVTTVTGLHNETMAQTRRHEGLRWELMDEWMRTPEFQAVEKGAVVYAPSLFKKLNNFALVPDNYWDLYVQTKSGKHIRITPRASEFLDLAGRKPANTCYYLKYSADSTHPHALFLFAPVPRVRTVNDSENSICVLGDEANLLLHRLGSHSVLLFQDEAGNRAIELPSSPSNGSLKYRLKSKCIRLNSVLAVNDSDALRFQSVHVSYGRGFPCVEENGSNRWAWSAGDGQDSELRLANLTNIPIEAELSFELVDWGGYGLVVTVQAGDARRQFLPPPQGSSLPVVLPVRIPPEGLTTRFHTEPGATAQTSHSASPPVKFGLFNPVVRQRAHPSVP